MAAGCFISNRSFLIGGGLERTSPNLEGTFHMFLNLVLSCPSTVCYENVNTATICIILLLLTWPIPISVSANIGNFRTTLAVLVVCRIQTVVKHPSWYLPNHRISYFWCNLSFFHHAHYFYIELVWNSFQPSALGGTFAWILVKTSSYNYVIWIFSWYLCFIFTSAATDSTCSQ